METVYSHTHGLCPVCEGTVQARIIQDNGAVYLEKFCPGHGSSRALVSSDPHWYEQSRYYVKPGQEPLKRNVTEFRGCPDSCGLCPQHQQHTCLPVIEITSACQLNCPVCLKNPASPFSLSIDQFEDIVDNLLETEGTVDVINISGGEPLLHPQLADFIELALQKGVAQVSVSTNGLRLQEDPETRAIFKRTGAIAALQFDGFRPGTYTFLRGADLVEAKLETIRQMESDGIAYSLVATVAKGINDDEIPAIAEYFFQSKALTLMFQPVAFTGSASNLDPAVHRLTIPCVVRQLEQCRYIGKGDFNPLPCSHFSCFALSYYLDAGGGDFVGLKTFLGEDNCLDICANRTLPGLDGESFTLIRDKIYELWSAADSSDLDERVLARIKATLRDMSQGNLSRRQKIALGAQHMKAVFIHHFMDLHTMDLGRLIKCCNPYPRPGGRLIPMCAENVFYDRLKGANHG